jgi:hypothetical protein
MIKGRGCADGRGQRIYQEKEDRSSPNVTLESVFLTSSIGATEGRDVATLGIPGAFMQANMDEEKNGKGSSSKRTRHINIRYFCIKDQADSGEV